MLRITVVLFFSLLRSVTTKKRHTVLLSFPAFSCPAISCRATCPPVSCYVFPALTAETIEGVRPSALQLATPLHRVTKRRPNAHTSGLIYYINCTTECNACDIDLGLDVRLAYTTYCTRGRI